LNSASDAAVTAVLAAVALAFAAAAAAAVAGLGTTARLNIVRLKLLERLGCRRDSNARYVSGRLGKIWMV
jgi:hypothetical protein